ncbi:MAG: oligosaccharide flippase family protein [Pseudomonadota bacterium]
MKEKIALLRNVAVVATASYIEAAVGLLAGVLVARTLGPTDYGHYAFGIWLCGTLIMAGNNALPTSSIKFLAEARGAGREDLAQALVSRFLRLQLASSGLVLAVFSIAMAIRPISDWSEHLPSMLAIAVVAVWSRAGFWMHGAISKGYELFVPENASLALTAIANLVLVVALAWRGASVAEFFAAYAVLGVISNLLVRYLLSRIGVRAVPGPIPDELARRLRRHLLLTGVMMLLVVATNRAVEMTLLKAYTTAETVGYFAIAGALTKGAVELLAGGMAAVLLPAMSRRFGQGGAASLGSMLAESTRLYWFVGLAIAGLGLTVSEGLVYLLYGQRYEGAIPALMWHLVVAGLVVVNGAAAAVLTASDRQLDRIRVIGFALIVNLVFGFLLIPRFGLLGAIASYAITQFADMAFCWWYAFRRTQVRLPLGPMARLVLAAAVATGLGYLVAGALHLKLAFLGGGAVFLMIYLSLSVRLYTWRAADFEVFANVLGRVPRIGAALSPRVLSWQRFAMAEAA